jgi:hypothetical protein
LAATAATLTGAQQTAQAIGTSEGEKSEPVGSTAAALAGVQQTGQTNGKDGGEQSEPVGATATTLAEAQKTDQTNGNGASPSQLAPEEQTQVRELQQRDREVRAHENAHISAGGSAVQGGPTFTYQTGPDGKLYASGGEVSIQPRSSSDDPDERIRHAAQLSPQATPAHKIDRWPRMPVKRLLARRPNSGFRKLREANY